MTLVVGSTGLVGAAVARHLADAGKPVRALVRHRADAAKVERLQATGATLVAGDLKDPASLRRACTGASTVVSTASSTISRGEGDTLESVDRDGQIALVEAALGSGVRHFIYLSFSANIEGDFPLRHAKRAVEQRLLESGLTYTIVRPSFFMEVWLSPHAGFDPVGGSARIFGSGDSRVSIVSAFDVARYLAGCVDNPAVHNQVIELGGPAAITLNAVVGMFEHALDRTIERQYVPEAALEDQLVRADDPLQKTRAGLALALARGDAIDVTPALAKVPITLTTIDEFVARPR